VPIRAGTTVDDVIRAVCENSQGPRKAREAGMSPDNEEQRKWEVVSSNVGYHILISLGYEHEEVREMLGRARWERQMAVHDQALIDKLVRAYNTLDDRHAPMLALMDVPLNKPELNIIIQALQAAIAIKALVGEQ
jgi:predicted aminopeptidase